MDYDWELWVEFGGIEVVWDSGHESNEGGSLINGDDIANIGDEAEARGIDVTNYLGIYKVGGFAASCNGFGFVKVISAPLESLTAKIAAGLAILLTILLLLIAFTGRRRPVAVPDGGPTDGDSAIGEDAAGAAATGAVGAAAIPGDNDDDGDVDVDDFNVDPGVDDLPDSDNLA
jgi:hypothetical protein